MRFLKADSNKNCCNGPKLTFESSTRTYNIDPISVVNNEAEF